MRDHISDLLHDVGVGGQTNYFNDVVAAVVAIMQANVNCQPERIA